MNGRLVKKLALGLGLAASLVAGGFAGTASPAFALDNEKEDCWGDPDSSWWDCIVGGGTGGGTGDAPKEPYAGTEWVIVETEGGEVWGRDLGDGYWDFWQPGWDEGWREQIHDSEADPDSGDDRP